jgi:hypothetical protein
VWATKAPDGATRVVLINVTARAYPVAVKIPGTSQAARLERLRAPGLDAPGEVTLAGARIDPATGALARGAHADQVSPIRGAYVVSVPAASAAMLTVR